jgi:hypothetical protein
MNKKSLGFFDHILLHRKREEGVLYLRCENCISRDTYVLATEEIDALAQEIEKTPNGNISLGRLKFEVTDSLIDSLKKAQISSFSLRGVVLKNNSEEKLFRALEQLPSLKRIRIEDVSFRNPFKAAAAFNSLLINSDSLKSIVFSQGGLFAPLTKKGFIKTKAVYLSYETGSLARVKKILLQNKNLLDVYAPDIDGIADSQVREKERLLLKRTLHKNFITMSALLEKTQREIATGDLGKDMFTAREAAAHIHGLEYVMDYFGAESQEIDSFKRTVLSAVDFEEKKENFCENADNKMTHKTLNQENPENQTIKNGLSLIDVEKIIAGKQKENE